MSAESALRYWLVAVLLALIPVTAAFAQPRRLEPADEAGHDSSWISFRNRLLNAVETRNQKYIIGILAPDVRSSLQAPRGAAEFRKQWDVDGRNSPLWSALRSALHLGSAYVERAKGHRELCAPYLIGKWPSDLDPFLNGVAIAREVLVKAEPSSQSATLQVLSYEVAAVSDWEVPDKAPAVKQRWVKVKVKNGEGYVPAEQIRSPVEHAACFVKTEHGWRMTGLAPGGG